MIKATEVASGQDLAAPEAVAVAVPGGGVAARARSGIRWRRVARLAVAAVVTAMVVTYVTLSGLVVLSLTRPERVAFTRFPEQYGLAYEAVSFPSRVDAV